MSQLNPGRRLALKAGRIATARVATGRAAQGALARGVCLGVVK